MVLERSRLTSQGFIVHSGIIDEDFKGEIEIMLYIKKNMC
jgi:deoxycytidine triphosphate deaminase